MKKPFNSNALTATSIFIGGLILFLYGIAGQEVIGFETRFYLFAQEMWRNGASWFPTAYLKPYPDYTVASTLLIFLVAKIFGDLNKFTAVLPSAIAASLTLSITYLIGCLRRKQIGIAAVLFLLLTFSFFKSARLITLDIYPTLITAICFYLAYSADVMEKPMRSRWIMLFLLLGFVFRGPIGFVIPAGVIFSYYFFDARWKTLLTFSLSAFFLLIICTIALLVIANYSTSEVFMHDVLRMQILGRIDNAYRPIYFYFVNSLSNYAISYPLALLITLGFILHRHYVSSDDKSYLLKLIGFVFIIMLGMSIPGDKKERYILPMAPACALLCAYLFSPSLQNYFVNLRRVLAVVLFFVPALFILGIEVIYFYDMKREVIFNINYIFIILFLIILQAANFLIVYYSWQHAQRRALYLLAVATASFCVTYIAAIEPIVFYFERGQALVQAVERERMRDHAILVFYKEKPDGLPIKYLIDMPKPTQMLFVDEEKDLLAFTQPVYVIAKEKSFNQLSAPAKKKFNIIANDMMGHVRIVVFTNQARG